MVASCGKGNFKTEILGWQDGPLGKGAFQQVWRHELDPQDPHVEGKSQHVRAVLGPSYMALASTVLAKDPILIPGT